MARFFRRMLVLGVIAVAVMSPLPALAAEAGVAAGTLTCNVAGGWGFIFGSSKDVQCIFESLGRTTERYTGELTKFGADIGYSGAGVMVWGVVAPTVNVASGSLEGAYAGATGGASVGVGVGANVLIGGVNNSIALQPLSVEGRTGLNVAAGIGALNLKSSK